MSSPVFTGEEIRPSMSLKTCCKTSHASVKTYLVSLPERADLLAHSLNTVRDDLGKFVLCQFCLCQPLNLCGLSSFGERVTVKTNMYQSAEVFIPQTELFRYVTAFGETPAKPGTYEGEDGVFVSHSAGISSSAPNLRRVPFRTKTLVIRTKKMKRFRTKPLKTYFQSLFHVKPETEDNESVKSESENDCIENTD